ncbi:hypothetical protein KDM41_14510, partial [bacterium]|nr:hypothetical protein [bacterium]
SPTGLDAATYAERLGVTPVRPWRSVADLDVFHLWRDDLAVVDALARGGVRTVGQWQRNGAALERAGVVDAATRRGTEARIAVWRSFRDGWRIGRGRPLEAGDLAGFGILSDLMLDAATALVAEVAGDADAFLARLQAGDVKRLRQDKKDALQEALERAGHVDDRPRRDEADLLAGCLAAVAPALAAGDLTTDAAAALVRRLKAAARA